MSLFGNLKRAFGREDKGVSGAHLPLPPSKAAMSELLVQAIIPVTRENWPCVQSVMKKPVWAAGDIDLAEIFRQHRGNEGGDENFVACDNPAFPVLIDGGKTRVQMWARKGMKIEGRNLVMIKSTVVGTDKKVIAFMPKELIRGTATSLVMVYRMSCCGEGSNSALISVSDKTGEQNHAKILDSNVEGIKAGMGSDVFRGKIGVAKDAAAQDYLVEMYEYIQRFYKAHGIVAPQ